MEIVGFVHVTSSTNRLEMILWDDLSTIPSTYLKDKVQNQERLIITTFIFTFSFSHFFISTSPHYFLILLMLSLSFSFFLLKIVNEEKKIKLKGGNDIKKSLGPTKENKMIINIIN